MICSCTLIFPFELIRSRVLLESYSCRACLIFILCVSLYIFSQFCYVLLEFWLAGCVLGGVSGDILIRVYSYEVFVFLASLSALWRFETGC